MRIRFQADADFKNSVVLAASRRWASMDIRAARAVFPDATPDGDVLRITAASGRVLLSHDVTTMPGHFARFVADSQSPGVILVPQSWPVGAILEGLFVVWTQWTPDDTTNALRWLPR